MTAQVRVMRSYDYCHFEIALDAPEGATLDEINETRKQAALLVDEAIRQYKIAKKQETERDNKAWQYEQALDRAKMLRAKPDSELSVNDAAFLRGLEDAAFWKSLRDGDYFYGDDPERDHHFSMLRRFQDTRISPVGSLSATSQ